MTLTRQHFALIAEGIASFNPDPSDQVSPAYERQRLADHFARILRRTNPNFNPSRFLRACGVEG